MTAGTASTMASSSRESWVLAADNPTARGMPVASITRWYLEPALPRSTGFAPVSSPTPGPHAHAVNRCPGPVDLAVVAQPVQQPMMQGFPHASVLPVAQPPPTAHAASTAQLLGRQQPPEHPGARHVDDPASTARSSIQGRPPLG